MKRTIGLAALGFFALLTLSLPLLAGDQERSAESFEKLRAECIKLAPAGWAVELTLVDAKNPAKPGDCPAIVIHTEKSLEPVAIRLMTLPYVSPIEYAAIKRRNDEHANQRLAMFKRMKTEKVNATATGSEPSPPSAFQPTSYTEIRRVWEYAFLWLETEPEPLPTHRFEILTLKIDAPQDGTIRDQAVVAQLKVLVESIKKTLTPYESPAKSGEKS
jgi:hypothetical protein